MDYEEILHGKITQEFILWRDFFVLFVRHRVEGRWITKKSCTATSRKNLFFSVIFLFCL
jgi:hypothetical protein